MPTPRSPQRSSHVGAVSRAGAVVLPTFSASGGQPSKRSLVEEPRYRAWNLTSNGVHVRSPDEELPRSIDDLVQYVGRNRGSDASEPSLDQLKRDKGLHELENGVVETVVENYFKDTLFPSPEPSTDLGRASKQPMLRHTVPDSGSQHKVKTPIPDLLFGYTVAAFGQQQQDQLMSMGTAAMANNANMVYPFLVVEFKGDGPLWAATNQCAGGSASCVKIAEQLNGQLSQYEGVPPVESAAFSIAMNGTEARLYITWKHNDTDYYMRKICSFLLQQPHQHLEFRKHVKNIIDWGRGARLEGIREALDSLGRRAEAQTIPESLTGTKRRASELPLEDVKRVKGPVS